MFAAIEKYRLPAQILLGAVAVSFVGFGVAQFETRPNNQYIVRIGEQIITRYQLDNVMRNNPNASRETILRQLMNQAYLQEGAKQLGLAVSEQEIKQAIVDNKAFHDANGKFSTEQFKNALSHSGMTEQQFMDSLRQDLLAEQMSALLQNNVVSDAQAGQLLKAAFAERTLRNVGLNPQVFEDKVDSSDAALKKFYDANQKTYTLPQAVQFEFVRFSPSSLAEKETLSDDELKKAMAEAANSPNNKRNVAHILIEFGADKAKAKAQAEQIAAEAQKQPEKFAELAKQHSQDADSKENGGVIGEFAASGDLINKAFKDAAFGLKSGAVSGVVESDFGFHIIKADDVGGAADENAVRQAAKEKKAQAAYTKLREQLSDEAFADTGSLKKPAEKLGLTIQTHTEWLTRENAPAAKIPTAVVDALFGDDVFTKKHNSEAIVVDGETWFVRATETRKEAVEPLDKIKDKVKQDFIRSESARLAKEEAKKMLADLQAGKNMQLAWSPVQTVAPQQMQGNLSAESYREVMAAAPKNGKPAYVLVDNLGAPQIIEIQKIQDVGGDQQALGMIKTMVLPSAKSLAWQEAYLDYLGKTIKTEQGSEKVSDTE